MRPPGFGESVTHAAQEAIAPDTAVPGARRYSVDPAAFYRLLTPVGDRVAAAMAQLIRAYGLAGKHVASIGCGSAQEESHLVAAGCRLTLFDLDEGGSIEHYLRRCAVGHDTSMTYYVGDFLAMDLANHRDRHDVVYLSSLTPDDKHRDAVGRRVDLGPDNEAGWYAGKPFHPAILAACAGLLRDGGLLIHQSYYGGFDHRHHTGFLPACERQLREAGLSLLDVYAYRISTGIKLMAAVKGNLPFARGELTMFHGRSMIDEPVERVICR
jgi:hypothetical protein